jgi:hypothetical protein
MDVFCRRQTSQIQSVYAPKHSVIIFSHTKSITYKHAIYKYIKVHLRMRWWKSSFIFAYLCLKINKLSNGDLHDLHMQQLNVLFMQSALNSLPLDYQV